MNDDIDALVNVIDGLFSEENKVQRATVEQLCDHCPVYIDCLAYSLYTKEVDGVWGASTQATRRTVIRKRLGQLYGSFAWDTVDPELIFDALREMFEPYDKPSEINISRRRKASRITT